MGNTKKTGPFYVQAIDDALAVYLNQHGISQDAFAKEVMGMSPNTFRWKRRGERDFSLDEATKLASTIGLSLDVALGIKAA